MSSSKPLIAFLASYNYDELLARAKIFRDEHALLAPQFEALGYKCEKVDWRSTTNDWSRYACLIPKAVWNYFDYSDEFVRFLKTIKAAGVPMQNPVDAVLWNMNKRYLLDYMAKGMPTIATAIYERGSTPDASWFEGNVLVKPAISGGAKNTIRFEADRWTEHRPTLDAILKEGPLVVQPYMKEVEEGEYSFIFFNDQLSHALLKKPKSGDFRAHTFFGADMAAYQPTDKEVSECLAFIRLSPRPCAYARVDVIRVKDVFHLVELEIIEPYLYMEFATSNPEKPFAEAVVRSLS